MKKSEMVEIIAEQLFYRDMANEHQFWYREQDRPLLKDDKDKDGYYDDARILLDKLEEAGLRPPLTKTCPVLLTKEHYWEKEND